jgi:hypothetical protein
VFPGTDPSFARRRIRALADQGWLTTWERPTRAGGHDRYALPTAEAIRHELASIPRDARWSPLVDCMLPRTKRAALHLAPGATPKWLAHQREVNHLVTRIATRPSRTILWASSWDAPFPSTLGMFTAPQPDYVLVEEGAGGAPRLVFGEHDRASEPVDRFVARKVALYTALATFPDACEQFFGVREFGVQVSVVDPLRHAPLSRLRALLEATRAHGGPDIFRFTLGGWLFGYPEAAIWCSTARAPIGDSPAWRDHANLTA